MKSLLVLFVAVAVAQATNWNEVTRMELHKKLPFNLPKFEGRIVNGEEVVPHSAPHQVGLLIKMRGQDRTAFCGGSLISNNYVLTAAHCIEPAESVEVVLGAHRIKDEEPTQVRLTSTDFKVHERWSRFTLRNDIAIVRLPQSVTANENIRIIGLPSKSGNNNIDDATVSVTGWGKDTDEATAISDVLRGITVPILPNGRCNAFYFGIITDSHVCTNSVGNGGSIGHGKSTCSGDSGGPLVLENTQVGIVSFGIALGCELGWPAAYTRVSEYLDWIQENTDANVRD